MLKLALCDDNTVQLEMIDELVRGYFSEKDYPAQVDLFATAEELLETVKTNGFYDAYILDMIMPGMKGIELGTELRKLGDLGRIVYLTATPDYAVDSYKVGAFFYLLKPLSKDSIYEVLNKIRREYDKEKTTSVTVKTKNGNKLIDMKDILYVDIMNRSLCYHLSNGLDVDGMTLRTPFQTAVKTLAENGTFVMCGSGTIVNVKNIDTLDREKVIFKCGKDFYPPKTAYSTFKEQVNKFFK